MGRNLYKAEHTLRKIKITIKIGREPMLKHHTLTAKLTEVAGLVVHPSVEWDTDKERAVVLRKKWSITQYPTGLSAFVDIPSEHEARTIVTLYMSKFNWVGLTIKDVHASHDAEATRSAYKEIKAYLEKLNA